jgi:hypothetical protein
MVLKVAAIMTLLTLTACREEQRTLPIVHAASISLQTTGQKQSATGIRGPMHKSEIDMQRITNELYKECPAAILLLVPFVSGQGDNAQAPCKHA